MQFMGTIKVIPDLPEELKRLKDLAYNLYFSWTPEARQLFRLIDRGLWTRLNHNPVKFLNEVQQKELERVANDPVYLSQFKKIMVEFDQYMQQQDTWFKTTHTSRKNSTIAYFSAEFGIHESLPIYSGGLGVLAGDHLKSASDLGLPLVGVSLLYHQTYFTQQIDAGGNQIALYIPVSPEALPVMPVLTDKGDLLKFPVQVGQKEVIVGVYKAQVGRITAFLLSTDLEENSPEARMITSRLYGGEEEMRISQEIILGMGGVIALKKMGIKPDMWHMNEGHSVFLALERIRLLVKEEGLSFYQAMEAVSSNTVFTTHTPVPAGNDAFPLHFVDKYFQSYWESIGMRRYQFMELGSQVQPEGYEIFNLTILSLKLSKFRNGVSKLHGEVSRGLWKDVWQNLPQDEVPITHITNGVHTHTWTVYRLRKLYEKYLGPDWYEHLDEPRFWQQVHNIPDGELWDIKLEIKQKMLNHMKERLHDQMLRNKIGTLQISRLQNMLDPNVLTIGFARRFATYKRGTLIFRNVERLRHIVNQPGREVQIVFAGKAHPKDKGGQELIRQINEFARMEGLHGRIFFIENYDMSLARDLVSGVDVWLNNPRRPQEASGTSGQKVGMNGGINFSVLDGWWVEGFNGKNGWAFGDREDYSSLDELDSWDSDAIYDILENDIVPLYYDKDEEGLPRGWINMMKHSMETVSSMFNTHRMVKDYVEQLYLPAMKLGDDFRKDGYSTSKEYSDWRERMEQNWSHVHLYVGDEDPKQDNDSLHYNEPFKLNVRAYLGEIDPADVRVQVYLVEDRLNSLGNKSFELVDMNKKKDLGSGNWLYEATIRPSNSGRYHYTVRMIPFHKKHRQLGELGLVTWLNGTE